MPTLVSISANLYTVLHADNVDLDGYKLFLAPEICTSRVGRGDSGTVYNRSGISYTPDLQVFSLWRCAVPENR